MRFAAACFAVLALAASTLAASAQTDDPAAPPSGVTASSMTLAHLMHLHYAARGSLAPGLDARTELWTYASGGLTGTQTDVLSGNDERSDVTLGPFHSASGEYGGKRWEQNENGLVRVLTGLHERDDVDAAALAHPTRPGSGVTLLGTVSTPSNAYVVKVAPPKGRVEYLFFDVKTFLITRSERAVEGERVVTVYDDFRTTNGLTEAWHVHRSNGLDNDDSDWKMQKLSIGTHVDASALAMPSARSLVTLSGAPVALPASISADRVILTMQMGAHKVNFQLDSGASNILVDRSVADATNVASFGTRTQVTAGQYPVSQALIPKMELGPIVLDDVAAESAPFHSWSSDDSPIAGLLGYDFIACCVLHIDYANGKVDAQDPAGFTPPRDAIALPIRLDDGVPVITARIGSAVGDHFIVDTGADRSMIFSAFAQANPSAVTDQGLGEQISDSLPFVDQVNGVGGTVDVRPVQVKSLGLGSITFPKWLFSVSQNAPSFESEDYDGLIGQDVLRNFDVYLDYARTTIYLVPNDRYRERWGSP